MGRVTILDRVAREGVTGKVRVKVRNTRKQNHLLYLGKRA